MTDKEIQRQVSAFKTEYTLSSVTYEALWDATERMGYTVVEFSPTVPDEAVDRLVHALKLQEQIQSNRGFTYASGNHRIIFIDERLSEKEKLIVLAHEVGHICCGHMGRVYVLGQDVVEEHEANQFADYLLSGTKSLGLKKGWLLYGGLLLALVGLVGWIIYAAVLDGVRGLLPAETNLQQDTEKPSETEATTTEETLAATTQEPTEEQSTLAPAEERTDETAEEEKTTTQTETETTAESTVKETKETTAETTAAPTTEGQAVWPPTTPAPPVTIAPATTTPPVKETEAKPVSTTPAPTEPPVATVAPTNATEPVTQTPGYQNVISGKTDGVQWELQDGHRLVLQAKGTLATRQTISYQVPGYEAYAVPYWRAGFDNETVTEIIVGEGVTEIPAGAFCHLPALTSVQLPKSLRVIGDGAFLDCPALTAVRLPGGVTTMGERVFDADVSLMLGE